MRHLLIGSVVLLLAGLCPAATNLLANGQLDPPAAGQGQLPEGWEALTLGVPARFATDRVIFHSAPSSIRIACDEVTRSYLRSRAAIAVVPGETIFCSAQVRLADVPVDHGNVMLIAEFSRADGTGTTVDKFAVADKTRQAPSAAEQGPSAGWQQISGRLTVPAGAFNLHIRMGLSYCRGTCWWDDVIVNASTPLAGRIDLPGNRLSPALGGLPVEILNRDKRQGPVKIAVKLRGRTSSARVNLDGKPQQAVNVPVEAGKPGKAKVELAIDQADGTAIYGAQQELTIPPPLTLGVLSPTHWVIEDGLPKIEAKLELAVKDPNAASQSLRIEVLDGFGRALRPASIAKSLADGVGSLSLSFSEALAPGDYKLIATLPRPGGKALTAQQPWHVIHRSAAKVTLDRAGYPVYEGKAIFPLGIFNGSHFQEQAEAGFTVTHAYNAVRLEEEPEHADENALRYLDQTQKYGMKMLFMVPMKTVIKGQWDLVRRRIRMFRNHPALLAWDEEEGFARGDFKPDTLKTLRKILQEEDPNHPFMVGDAKTVITRIPPDRADFFPVNEMDLGMWWWYPFPLKSATRGTLLGGDEGAPGSALAPPAFLVNAHLDKPLWVGVQAYKKPTADGRFPTPAEYRAQAYLALISGAKGLMWYGGSVEGGIFIGDNQTEGHWDALAKVAGELHGLSEVLMSPALEPPRVSSPLISVMLKKAGGRMVLCAVNRGDQTVQASIESPIMPGGGAKVLDEQRNVEVRGGQLRDRFEPYGTHVYEWAK